MTNRILTVTSATPIFANNVLLSQIGASVDSLAATVAITFLRFTPVASPPPSGFAYDYKIRTVDSRNWNQVMTFASSADTDPRMTFSVPDGWKLSEFVQQRIIRDLLVQLVVEYGLTTLKYDF